MEDTRDCKVLGIFEAWALIWTKPLSKPCYPSTPQKPWPLARVRVLAGKGQGQPELTLGLPLPITIHYQCHPLYLRHPTQVCSCQIVDLGTTLPHLGLLLVHQKTQRKLQQIWVRDWLCFWREKVSIWVDFEGWWYCAFFLCHWWQPCGKYSVKAGS